MTSLAAARQGGESTGEAAATLFGLGGGFTLIGLVILVLVAHRRAATRRATGNAWGRVVAMEARRQVLVQPGEISSPVHPYPTVAFIDDHGQQRFFQARVGFSWQRYQVGQVVPVRYDPANSDVVRIGTSDLVGAIGAAIGVLVAFVGLLMILGGLSLGL